MLVAGGLDRPARALEKHVVEVRVESRLDQQHGRHDQEPTGIGRSSMIASP